MAMQAEGLNSTLDALKDNRVQPEELQEALYLVQLIRLNEVRFATFTDCRMQLQEFAYQMILVDGIDVPCTLTLEHVEFFCYLCNSVVNIIDYPEQVKGPPSPFVLDEQ
jgi:hypothetical protein